MGSEEVIDFLLYAETINVNEKWQIFLHILEHSNEIQKDMLYNRLAEYKIKEENHGNV